MKLFLVLLTAFSFQAEAFPLIKDKKVLPRRQFQKSLFFQDQQQFNFDGILKLSNCSGALVRFNTSLPNQKALALTNGHCVDFSNTTGMIPPNVSVSNLATYRTFKFLDSQGTFIPAGIARSTKLIYATMTGTDVSLYELEFTYEEIERKFSVHALTLSSEHPTETTPVQVLSGYFQSGYSCMIDRFVHELREGDYRMNDAIRYSAECDMIHGTSGSPILSAQTREVIGIHNTGNDDGEKCTIDNPCEVSEDGIISVRKDQRYGQQTHQLYTCLNGNAEIDLSVPGCKLKRSGPPF